MNRNQLIVAWVMAVVIFVVIFASRDVSGKNSQLYDLFKAVILIVGGALIFALRSKKEKHKEER